MQRLSIVNMLALHRLPQRDLALIDVRSELEFAKASAPGFVNLPIMRQAERHEVGLTYKQLGQIAAIARGEELVGPHLPARLAAWKAAAAASPQGGAVVGCWRGGLRSQFVCGWLIANGVAAWQLEGGYKALRHAYLEQLQRLPRMLVLSGLTGAGKTELLTAIGEGVIDLEEAAKHRGSAFGDWLQTPQPPQATFENRLAVQFLRLPEGLATCLIEDESRLIGSVSVPETVYRSMQQSPLVILEDSLDSRAARIHRAYIEGPLKVGITPEQLQQKARMALTSIKRRLDHQGAAIYAEMEAAFARGLSFADHAQWLAALLSNYYDRSYTHARARSDRQVAFRGNFASCLEWCKAHLADFGSHT